MSELESRVAVLETTVRGLGDRQAEIIEWKHDAIPKALSDVTLRVMAVDDKLDAHLLVAAPKVAEVERLIADVAELKGQVAGQEGLMPRLARIETEMHSHGQALAAITAGRVVVAVVSFLSGAVAVGAAWPEFSRMLGNVLKALAR